MKPRPEKKTAKPRGTSGSSTASDLEALADQWEMDAQALRRSAELIRKSAK